MGPSNSGDAGALYCGGSPLSPATAIKRRCGLLRLVCLLQLSAQVIGDVEFNISNLPEALH